MPQTHNAANRRISSHYIHSYAGEQLALLPLSRSCHADVLEWTYIREAEARRGQCHLAYLLRIWRVGPRVDDWRATLESASTGERCAFASLHDLYAWIQAQAESVGSVAAEPPKAEVDIEHSVGTGGRGFSPTA